MLKHWAERIKAKVLPARGRAGGDLELHQDQNGPFVDCRSYHALVALYGFVKYDTHANVLIRGQSACYGKLIPSAYRGDVPTDIDQQIERFLSRFREAMRVDPLPQHQATTEPVLQHYGIPTRWLDLVDSIPHALYFATCEFKRDGERIRLEDEASREHREYGWLYFVDCGSDRDLRSIRVLHEGKVVSCRGAWVTEDGFQFTDLRRAKPSKALRPHAQHGYLCRPAPGQTNLWNTRLLVRARVRRVDAVAWLGNGDAFKYDALFPRHRDDRYYAEMSGPEAVNAVASWRASGASYDPIGILQYHDRDDGEERPSAKKI